VNLFCITLNLHYLCRCIGFGYAMQYIRRRGNQVKILNRPATVNPMQRFDESNSHCAFSVGRRFRTGI